jgi:manganese/iron transport system permease protein
MMVVAAVLTAICGWIGLAASYEASVSHGVRLAAGAMVVTTITAGFLVVATVVAVRNRLTRPAAVPEAARA